MFFWGLWLFSFWTETYSVENYTFIYFSGLAPKKGSRNEAQIWATNTEGALCTFSVCGPDSGFKCGPTFWGQRFFRCNETPVHIIRTIKRKRTSTGPCPTGRSARGHTTERKHVPQSVHQILRTGMHFMSIQDMRMWGFK